MESATVSELHDKREIGRIRCSESSVRSSNMTRSLVRDVLKMNFSVGVNMYNEKVTSYWYRLRWNQRSIVDGYNIAARRRAEAEDSRTTVAKEVVSTIGSSAGCL